MTHLPPCDFETLKRIEAYAPHLLTAQDRHCLRLHKAAPAVYRRLPAAVLAIAAVLAALPFIFVLNL